MVLCRLCLLKGLQSASNCTDMWGKVCCSVPLSSNAVILVGCRDGSIVHIDYAAQFSGAATARGGARGQKQERGRKGRAARKQEAQHRDSAGPGQGYGAGPSSGQASPEAGHWRTEHRGRQIVKVRPAAPYTFANERAACACMLPECFSLHGICSNGQAPELPNLLCALPR
jgi:hypothetical protein